MHSCYDVDMHPALRAKGPAILRYPHREEQEMPASVSVVLLVIAFICFILAAAGIGGGRINLIALGLAIWVLSLLVGGGQLSP